MSDVWLNLVESHMVGISSAPQKENTCLNALSVDACDPYLNVHLKRMFALWHTFMYKLDNSVIMAASAIKAFTLHSTVTD